jgi:hypothetical protein
VANETRVSAKVVVALLDGKRERGFVYNFSPNGATFYLFPSETADASFAKLVEMKDCKAIFFVKTHEGSKADREAMRKRPNDVAEAKIRGHRMRITFSDGEELLAASENYNPTRLGFFAFPFDPRSNNLRIFVVNENVQQVATGKSVQLSNPAGSTQDRVVRTAPPPAGPQAAPPVAPGPGAGPASRPVPPLLPPLHTPGPGEFPVEMRVEAVLRIIAGRSPVDLAEEIGVPAGVLAYWSQVFLLHGRAALSGKPATPSPDDRDGLIAELSTKVRGLEAEIARLREAARRRALET